MVFYRKTASVYVKMFFYMKFWIWLKSFYADSILFFYF